MLKAIKVRIYPDDIQQNYLSNLFGCSRFIYNKCLSHKKDMYDKQKVSLSFGDIGRYLTNLKTEYIWLKDVHSKVLQQSLIDMNTAYTNFFKHGSGFPKFKSRSNHQSVRFPVDAIMGIRGNRINIIKPLKNIHFKCSKRDERILNSSNITIKSGTLSKTKSGKYFFSILVDTDTNDTNDINDINDNILAIDLGIKDFVITSDGDTYANIKIKRNNQLRLAKLHRNLSRKKKGSKNREKARIKLARYYEKLNNIKENYLHKVVNQLLDDNQVIVIEDLNVSGMMKNHKLARSIQELSLNRFKQILTYKANWQGKTVIKVDRFFPSSKLCSNCGYKNTELELKDRYWTCNDCNTYHDRDINAAKNILCEGKRMLNSNAINDHLNLEFRI